MPSDPPPPDRAAIVAFLRAQEWGKIRVELLRFAVPRCKSRELAEDLVQDAIIKVMTGDSSFDPSKHASLPRYMMGAIKYDLADTRRSARARKTVALSHRRPEDDDAREGDHLPATNAFSEDVAVRVDLFTRRMNKLREKLAGDALALQLLDLTVDGVDTPAERATATGKSFEAIEAARRRMQFHAAAVAHEISGDDADEAADDDRVANAPRRAGGTEEEGDVA
jgi:RNA polymerase sigma factor (sigma-70 family)